MKNKCYGEIFLEMFFVKSFGEFDNVLLTQNVNSKFLKSGIIAAAAQYCTVARERVKIQTFKLEPFIFVWGRVGSWGGGGLRAKFYGTCKEQKEKNTSSQSKCSLTWFTGASWRCG